MFYLIGKGGCPEGNFSKFQRHWIEFMLAFALNLSNPFIIHLNHATVQYVNIHIDITLFKLLCLLENGTVSNFTKFVIF